MREAGKNQITVWADSDQAKTIRTMLAGEAMVPQVDVNQIDTRERNLEEREHQVLQKEELIKRKIAVNNGWMDIDENEKRLKEAQASLDRRRADFEREQSFFSKKSSNANKSISFSERKNKLVEIHTTTSWDNKIIDNSLTASDRSKQMADISRKTSVAASTIKDLLKKFSQHQLLTNHEQAALEITGKVLADLGSAAKDAKDLVVSNAKTIKDNEEKRRKAAKEAAKQVFGEHMSPEDCVAVYVYTKSYELRHLPDNLKKMSIAGVLSEMQRNALGDISSRIEREMREGLNVQDATTKIRTEFDLQRIGAIAANVVLIQDINVKAVAAKLEAANSK